MQFDAVHDRTHGVFADAEVQHSAVGITGKQPGLPVDRQEASLTLGSGVLGFGEVSRAAPNSGILDEIALSTFPEAARVAMPLGSTLAGHHPGQPLSSFLISRSCNSLRSGLAAAHSCGLLPLLLNLRTALDQLASVRDHFIGNLESLVQVEAQHLLGSCNFLHPTQRRAPYQCPGA